MMSIGRRGLGSAVAVVAALGLPAGEARAGMLDTVNWEADGTGTGTLANGTTTVVYTTAMGSDAGTSFGEDWATYRGTNDAVGMGVTVNSGGMLGGSATATKQTITFSAPVTNPILLVNYLNKGDLFDFGPAPIVLLDSFNATRAGDTIAATDPTHTADDGFGVRIPGTFGPGTPLTFTYRSDGGGTDGLRVVGFTVGVPEPSSLALAAVGLLGLAALPRRPA